MASLFTGRGLGALAALLAAPLAFGQVTLNADRAGGDIARFADPDINNMQCAARCDGNAHCQAWVLVKDGSQGGVNVCYLKSTVANATPNHCCDTGVKVSRPNSLTKAPRLEQRPLQGGLGTGPARTAPQGQVDRVTNPSGNVGHSNLPLQDEDRGSNAGFQDLHRGAGAGSNPVPQGGEASSDWRPPPVIP